ncbi:hypothetical protein TNCT_393081 [Trichonephila clavata]|uniref:Uncharacterized protein n=1 Tax=Trichonephila clavata TaxID=2740835 RepID=A0A8X6HG97_TRICU|nr:hypothetical protein TNCT_393081 [Trichonephila clavata]
MENSLLEYSCFENTRVLFLACKKRPYRTVLASAHRTLAREFRALREVADQNSHKRYSFPVPRTLATRLGQCVIWPANLVTGEFRTLAVTHIQICRE